MSLPLIIILFFSITILIFSIFFTVSIRKISSLHQVLQNQLNIFELNSTKTSQEQLFRFQQIILDQNEHSQNHNQFVFEEMDKKISAISVKIDLELNEIKTIVNEKLHKTLDHRLGQSFKLVSDSLDKVQFGLGEMQALAQDVGDLKKVLNNVKTRGVLGEFQLGSILEQMLSQEQYELNVSTIPHSNNFVEFAIKFPGKTEELPYIWLPIDAKFPLDLYDQLLSSFEQNNKDEIKAGQKRICNYLKKSAAEIRDKYIFPPYTTDFGILFVPIEGLYAEILRMPGLIMEIQKDYKILIVGPNNLAAFLSTLQHGFRSIAIEKRTEEVWNLLKVIRSEFGKFGDILNKTQKKILEANKVIEQAGARSRSIERSLHKVDQVQFLNNGK